MSWAKVARHLDANDIDHVMLFCLVSPQCRSV